MSNIVDEPVSVAVFCPQSKAPDEAYLQQLRLFMCHTPILKPLLQAIVGLSETWHTFANVREDIAALSQGERYTENLSDWIENGNSAAVANSMSSILSLPLLTIIQITQYFQYLERQGINHSEFLSQIRVGGAQGYCGGLLPAIAIASSRNEAEVVQNAITAMRIAVGIGAYGELGDDESIQGPTTIVIRLKWEGQGEDVVRMFPGTHVSAITDPKTISLVGSVPQIAKARAYAEELGLLTSEMHIRGKMHNPENSELARELCHLCDEFTFSQLPAAKQLLVPVRSNRTGQLLSNESLIHEVIETILASRCEWFDLMTETSKDLKRTGKTLHVFAIFGIGDCVPLMPFNRNQLRIAKLDVLSHVKGNIYPKEKPKIPNQYEFPGDAIAVVGAACRLPGANTLKDLWDLISTGTSKAKEVPQDRVDIPGSFRASQDKNGASKRKFYGNFIDDADSFDHIFFGTSPREAMFMDPQQRLLLEVAFQAMDSSGYLHSHRRDDGDPVGCFIGASFAEYLENTSAYNPTAYTSTGTIRAFLSGKLSYYFGWSGPSEVIDTACSSSLVAIHRACRAIQSGECPLALAGGVNIITGVHNYLDLGKANFLSPTGQCKPFDENADGYCRGEGVGLVVLKLLSRATADGDQVLGVIPGIATNQGGLSPSITIPHSPMQVKLYQTILHKAGMEACQISYVEAHGTGTQAGDPLEMASIREVFGGQERSTPLHVGSLKANIGHAETAAGVASLLKVLAMINYKSIPPLAGFRRLNSKIAPLESDNIRIASEVIPWELPIRVACVNSYGAAGSNSALLCCELQVRSPKNPKASAQTDTHYPVFLSAASAESLQAYGHSLVTYIRGSKTKLSLGDLAFTLSERRKHHSTRWVTTTSDISNLAESLEKNMHICFEIPLPAKHVVLMFAGQSKQIVGLDREMYQAYPRLRFYLDLCNSLSAHLGYGEVIPAVFQSEPISDIVTLQCSIFAVQYACAKCWIDAGLKVDAIIGHSFGELTGMVVSGVLSLENGLKLIATRASLVQSKWGPDLGSMLAIHGSREVVRDVIASLGSGSAGEEPEIACYNGPSSQVVVGTLSVIQEIQEIISEESRFRGLPHQRLDVSHGFHSRFTEPLLSELDANSRGLTFNKPSIPLETCTDNSIDTIDCDHIVRHTRKPVYFSDAIRRLEQRLGPCVWLEAGFDNPIIAMAKIAVQQPEVHTFHALKTRNLSNPTSVIASTTASLWREGISTSFWNFINPQVSSFEHVWLPPYNFQRIRHWLKHEGPIVEAQKTRVQPITVEKLKLVTRRDSNGGSNSLRQFTIHLDTQRYRKIISGHAVRHKPLCPASMYMECAVMAAQSLSDLEGKAIQFKSLSFQGALGIDYNRDVSVWLESRTGELDWDVSVQSLSRREQKSKLTHAKGQLRLVSRLDFQLNERLISGLMSNMISNPNTEKLKSKRAYDLFSRVVHYADFLQGIHHISLAGNQAIAEIKIPQPRVSSTESTAMQMCDAVSLDIFIQVVGLLINSSDNCLSDEVFIAAGIENIEMLPCNFNSNESWTVYAMFTSLSETQATGDIFVFTQSGELVITGSGIRFSKIPIPKLERLLETANPHVARIVAPGEPEESFEPINSTVVAQGPNYNFNANMKASSKSPSEDHALIPGSSTVDLINLRSLISAHTGLRETEIVDHVVLAELGLDLLAVKGLADNLQFEFGIQISPEDLLISSPSNLSGRLKPSSSKSVKTARDNLNLAQPMSTNALSHPSQNSSMSSGHKSNSHSARKQKVLQIISDSSGATIDTIEIDATLQDIGFDSLSTIELKSLIEESFSIEMGDGDLNLQSTVQQILKYLNLECKSPTANDTALAIAMEPLAQRVLANGNTDPKAELETENRHQMVTGNESKLTANLIKDLIKSEASFELSAERHGFLNYWVNVAPREDELLLAYINEAFRKLGVDLQEIRSGEIVKQVSYMSKHAKVLQRLLEILERLHIVTRKENEIFRADGQIPDRSSKDIHSRFIEDYPHYACEANLMKLTGPMLAECLSGKADPMSLLFGNQAGQVALEEFYTSSPMLATLTDLLVNFMKRIMPDAPNIPIRILEVGAGFGGTTKRLAEVIHDLPVSVEYTFSDVSYTLVRNARTKFASYNWMNFQVFNLENDVPDHLSGKYDIVLGTNCVHATSDKVATTSRMRHLLKPGGFILLSEITKVIDWHDIVYGLLDGWWLAKDGSYALQPANSWMRCFEAAGFHSRFYSSGSTTESKTQQLLFGCTEIPRPETNDMLADHKRTYRRETVIYKEIDGVQIAADIYLPMATPRKEMPIALMIHGGGHISLSRIAIRVGQMEFLLSNGVLPISIDFRLCPEVNFIDGPMTDVRDAYAWAQSDLPDIVRNKGFIVDPTRIVVIGWSTGGHLALTTAWTTKGLTPPRAILCTNSPTDFEAPEMNLKREELPERKMPIETIRKALSSRPITTYHPKGETGTMGWLLPGDPRSELMQSFFEQDSNGLNLLLNGLQTGDRDERLQRPDPELVTSINPIAQVRKGNYHVPTYLIAYEEDEVVPFPTAVRFVNSLKVQGVKYGFLQVPHVKHDEDLHLKPGMKEWATNVEPAYRFLFDCLGI